MLSSPLIFVACIVALFAMRGKPLERYLFSIGFILAAIWMLLPWGFYVAYPVQTHENYMHYPSWNSSLFRLSFLPFDGPLFHRIRLSWVVVSSIFNGLTGFTLARFVAIRKAPNQSSEPTSASGTSPAGQEPRLP